MSSTLTLQEAIDRALAANPSMLRADANRDAARRSRAGAGAPTSNPSFGFEAGPRIGGGTIGLDVGVGLQVPLDVGGTPLHLRRSAEAAVQATDAEARLARLQVVVGVRRAYAEAKAADQRLNLARESLEVAGETERVARRRHELGEVALLEPNSAELQRLDIELAVLDADSRQVAAFIELRRWLAWDALTPLVLADELASPTLTGGRDREALITAALEARPEVDAADARRKQAEANLRANRGAGAPGVSLTANWTREGAEANVVTGGLTFELPVQRNQLAVAQATGAASRAAIEADAIRLTVSREAAQAAARWSRATARHEFAVDRALPLAAENLRLLQRAYESGKEDLIAVLLMQNQALQARAKAIDAMVELHRAAAALELATGEELFE